MSLGAFQRVMADLVASPSLCLYVREDATGALRAYDLTEREHDRVTKIVWQRGMSTNCSLYRANRITPLYTHLALTCTLLGERMMDEVECFWRVCDESDLQFAPEIKRFGDFLRGRIRAGEIDCPCLESVVNFELAVNALLYVPRRQSMNELPAQDERTATIQAHPLVRLIRFTHDPSPLLSALAAARPPPDDLRQGEFFVVVQATTDDIGIIEVDAAIGLALEHLQAGVVPDSATATALITAELAVG